MTCYREHQKNNDFINKTNVNEQNNQNCFVLIKCLARMSYLPLQNVSMENSFIPKIPIQYFSCLIIVHKRPSV